MKTNDGIRTSRRGFLLAVGTAATGAAMGVLPFGAHAAAAAEGAEKIGIIGSGRIGGTLGELWLKSGHEAMFSSLDIEHDKALAARLGGKARAGTTKEAAAFGDVVLVAVPYSAMPQLGKDLADTLKGKTIIDTSNPILARDGDIAKWAREKGAGLASAELLPGTRIVRAFNAIGYAKLPEASKQQPRIGMPIAGDDANAITVASRLVREIGYEPVVVGSLAMGKFLIPGTPLAGEHRPDELKQIASTLK